MRVYFTKLMPVFLALVFLSAWLWLKQEKPKDSIHSVDAVGNDLPQPGYDQSIDKPADQVEGVTDSVPPRHTVAGFAGNDGKQVLQAYRIAVHDGVLSLDGTQRIVGDFHRRRGPLPWMSGMWCVRLLDADMRVLAEETANAPDDVCVVLDPQNRDASGNPQAAQFAGAGEEAMLQVRLSPHPDAKWLKVYRLAGSERADWNTEPTGELLTTISLP